MKASRFHLLLIAVLAACSNGSHSEFNPSAGAALTPAYPAPSTRSQNELYRYAIVKLDTLGGSSAIANGVNQEGLVSGDANLPGDQRQQGAVWQGRHAIDLGTLGGPNSLANWPPKESGAVAVLAETSNPDPLGEDFCAFGTHLVCQGFVWRRGHATPPLVPFQGGDNSQPQAMNDRGDVSGYAENGVQDSTCAPPQVLQFRGAVWGHKGGQPQELSPIGSDPDSVAFDINNRGQVVGASGICGDANSSSNAFHAVMWNRGSPTNLGSLGGAINNVALSLNERGDAVGFSDLPSDATFHPFLWRKKTGMIDLGVLPGDVFGFSSGINNRDQAVGEVCDASGNCRGFLWQRGAMTDFNSLIAPHSKLYVLATKWINDDGIVVGMAYDASTGETPAFIAVPLDAMKNSLQPARQPILPMAARNRAKLGAFQRSKVMFVFR
jgi:probable HAF family extracellular repeat protein